MRYLVGCMIVGFFGSGLLFLFVFLRELGQKVSGRRRLLRAEGLVVSVTKKLAPRGPGQIRMRPYWMFFPVVTFTPPGGTAVTFTSEVGDGGPDGPQSRYRVGQRLAVRYDPAGRLPPMLDCWSALWLPPLVGIGAGLVFLSAAALTCWAFGDRVFGLR